MPDKTTKQTTSVELPVTFIKSIGFQYDPIEDRIRCLVTGKGDSLDDPDFWMTQRMAHRFLAAMYKDYARKAAGPAHSDRGVVRAGTAEQLMAFGRSVEMAKLSTTEQMGSRPARSGDYADDRTWLVKRLTVRETKPRRQLLFIGDERAVGIALRDDEFLSLVHLLETAFQKADWPLPKGSAKNVGAVLAQETGTSIN